ncbi:IPT/TIG domain-containing protein [Cytophagaceae bacterium YF14B1]|uniref:IPT/TIG domain-containing protein n=1 Tax=Xanthocytophaga flava TaxID=3048013 RepID=A0AAE3QKI6_9BACT|nr:IPT/TIG domain-containing protein [Xanthocytophaga flavus]MDJ1481057.1 IPT/TIG domain-containing protein [Xanthocytophaga flavus]
MRFTYTLNKTGLSSFATTLVLTCSLLTACQPGEEATPAETITFTPASALVGDTITLSGKHFSTDPAKNTVSFEGKEGQVVSATDSILKVIVPDSSASGKISVKSEAGSGISATDFKVFNLYIVGFGETLTPPTAMYWRNGKPTILSSPEWTSATDIAISGKHIYIGGMANFGYSPKALLWKDGQLTQLYNGTEDVFVNSIFVNNNDVYVAGYSYKDKKRTAVYWKNNQVVKLGSESDDDFANAIAVVNNDVYVVGRKNYVGTYWKNGQPVVLKGESTETDAKAIAIVNNDVYIAGSEYIYTSEYQGSQAMYWKNGEPVRLNDAQTTSATSSDIKVVNNDVYVTGLLSKNDQTIAVYWKNGVLVELSDFSRRTRAFGLEVFNNHVYVVGEEWIGGRLFPRLWKDGREINMTHKSISSGTNYSVVIAE